MQTARSSARVFARAAAMTALACVTAVAVGCSPSGKTPTSQPLQVSGAASSTPSTTAAVPATQTTPTKTVDCAGAAVSSTLTVGATGSKPQIGSIARPSDAVVIAGAKKVLLEIEGAKLSSAKVVSMTQDKAGRWWVLLSTMDKETGAAKAVISFDGKEWEENVYGYEINDEDLPPDVRF